MGQRLTRPIRNFNVENRAAKAIERQQKAPKAAPKHAGTMDAISQTQQEKTQILSEMENKNEMLHERLKQIYVDSKDNPIQIKSARPVVSLTRQAVAESDLGVLDVSADEEVPQGRSSLKTLISLISRYQEDPTTKTTAEIAKDHRLDPTVIQDVLTHFKVMHLHLPKELYKETKNMGKIEAEQLEASKNIASSFKFEGKKERDFPKTLSGQSHAEEPQT